MKYRGAEAQIGNGESDKGNQRLDALNLSPLEQKIILGVGVGRIASEQWVGKVRTDLRSALPAGTALAMRKHPAVMHMTGRALAGRANYRILRNEKGAADPTISIEDFLINMFMKGKLDERSAKTLEVPFLNRLMLTPIEGSEAAEKQYMLVAHTGDRLPDGGVAERGGPYGVMEQERAAIQEVMYGEKADSLRHSTVLAEGQRRPVRHKLHLGVLTITAEENDRGKVATEVSDVLTQQVENNLGDNVELSPVGFVPVAFGYPNTSASK
ncbi:MAG TPA: hypothetical protein VD947_01565 [Patescibacteria group bacterium]|nr:hypothetical protein [Patescibacteria group bacterium]